MKYRRLALVLPLLLSVSMPAIAASVVMVQFGSFETKEEAEKRLSEVKSAHSDLLGSIGAGIREVKLPPDNLTVYRTQAGPVESRAAGQSLCMKFATTGDECYVVETAVNNGAGLPKFADATPAAPIVAAPIVTAAADVPPAPSPEMQSAMDRAVLSQNAAEANPPTVTPATRSSFWSRMNPFGATETTAATSAAATAAAVSPAAAPVTSVEETTMPPLLPPPPAPLLAQYGVADTARTAEPMGDRSVQLTPPPAPAFVPPAPAPTGSVRVEEAKRVPLTEYMAAPVAMTPTAALMPSATLGVKTLWAQLGQFNDRDAAMAFWQQYRSAHPDFPTVRVRIVSSVQQRSHGNDRVWLRVGPFGREGSIRNLCRSIRDMEDLEDNLRYNLRCGNVTDLGVAGKVVPMPGYLSGSRYNR